MQFNSFSFLLFFPAVLAVYAIAPRKLRIPWLLAASYYFYMSWNARYALLLAFSTLATYFGALGIARCREKGAEKAARRLLIAVLAANLALLGAFKYGNFLLETLASLLRVLHAEARLPVLELLLPVGISFYTFQAIGYTVDVYRGKLEPERDLLRYALFVSFFPQLVAGPIERAERLLPQIRALERIELYEPERLRRGCMTMLGGFLMKLLIADRAAIAVNTVYNDPAAASPFGVFCVMLLFAIQIYCDFAGYSTIAVGSARLLGVELMENFHAPYLAESIRDFWGRWHISLSTWFMDYLYIPLGGNRRGKARKLLNLTIVFAVSGLWHGAAWHFVLWGLLHALFRVIEELSFPARRRLLRCLRISEKNPALRLFRVLLTFLLVAFALVFFRADSLSQALLLLRRMVSGPWSCASLLDETGWILGLRGAEMALLLVCMLLLLGYDLLKERGVSLSGRIAALPLWLRLAVYLFGILALLLFGVYGPGYDAAAFLYFQF